MRSDEGGAARRAGALIISLSLAMGIGARTIAAPALTVDLASKTAWTFRPEGQTAARTLSVPAGGWRLNGFPNATSGTYERRITVPKLPGPTAQVTQIAFEAVNWEATVWVGTDAAHLQEIGRHLSAWTPFRMDISRAVTPGRSALLRVAVRDRNSFKDAEGRFTVPAATEWNDRQARGILRGVALQVYPTAYMDDVFVRPDTRANTLAYDVTLVNADRRARTVTWSETILAHAPGGVSRSDVAFRTRVLPPGQTTKVTIRQAWRLGRASWWFPNVPYRPEYRPPLQRLTLRLYDGPKQATELTQSAQSMASQTESVRFGFCTPGQSGASYTLNGVRVNLRGDSLPEGAIGTDAFARLPGFLPPRPGNPGWPGAVRNYLRLNYNVVRMHQVPCTRYMMDVCDELGLLVIPETAIRGAGGPKENVTVQPEAFATHLRELILRDRNHPSVFKWSLENELFGAPEAFIRRLYDVCRETDGTRPCSLDDNAEYPAWPGFAVIEHYTQGLGADQIARDPDAIGGHPRRDRPYGQGEYIWPRGNSAQGAVWWGALTRTMRFHDNADLRPYTLLDVWPGVIPGLTPTNFPDPALPPVSLEQGGRSLLNPADPWQDGTIQNIQRAFAPVAIYDRDFDLANTRSNGRGQYPAQMVALPAQSTITRQCVAFNDEFAGEKIEVRVLRALRLDARNARELPPITRTLTVPLGGHVTFPLAFTTPDVPHNAELVVALTARKNGQERYRELLYFVITPQGKNGAAVRFQGRDDKTQGDWVGVYGRQAFLIPIQQGRSGFQLPDIDVRRGTGYENIAPNLPPNEPWEEQNQILDFERNLLVTDRRVALRGPGLTERFATAFTARQKPLTMRVSAEDGAFRQLSLYLLDYKRGGQAVDVDIFDTQGHRLDSQRVGNFAEGAYLNYRFRGALIVRVVALDASPPTLSGIFVDADAAKSQTP